MNDYRQIAITINNLVPQASATPVLDSGDWMYIAFNDQPFLQVKLGQSAPFTLRARQMVVQSFEQMILTNPGPDTIADAQIVYGQGTPPTIPPADDEIFDYTSIGDVVVPPGRSLVVSPNGVYRFLDLCIPTGQANGLRISDVGTGAAAGMYLPVGVPWRIPASGGGVYAYNGGAGNVTITANFAANV